jgi:hypothetical protein
MFYLETQNKVQSSSEALKEELQSGTLVIEERPAPSNSVNSPKKKGKGRK